jgi:UDPglucose 6-dehydrogenase
MAKETIGIIGNGFVGGAIVQGFSTFKDIFVYDNDPNKSVNSLDETLNAKYIFVCLPTPMVSAEGGECNLSIIENFFSNVKYKEDQVFIIKSTVPVGTTKRLREEYSLPNIVHCPEFLTARTARVDFICAARSIVGGESMYRLMVKSLLEERFPGTPVYLTTSDESELIKYASNCFFATKIIFFNEMRLLCDEMKLNWDSVIQGIVSDGRIGQSHFQVPGHDGEYGFGGACFPKDVNAMIKTMEEHGLNPELLKAVWDENKRIRKDWDWAKNKSSVLEV